MSKSVQTIHVKVVNADQILMDTQAIGITATNKTGKFDILPDHQPFITLLSQGDVILRKPGKEIETITIDKGIIRIFGNEAVLIVDL